MNTRRTWLEYPVYKVYRNPEGYWEAAILLPTIQTPTIFNGEETFALTLKQIKDTCGENSIIMSEKMFQEEVVRRTTHSDTMLAMLKDNWTGKDLSAWHVYGSISRPMDGIRIDGTVFLKGNGAKYQDRYEIYEYVVAQTLLDASIIVHYNLVIISHP